MIPYYDRDGARRRPRDTAGTAAAAASRSGSVFLFFSRRHDDDSKRATTPTDEATTPVTRRARAHCSAPRARGWPSESEPNNTNTTGRGLVRAADVSDGRRLGRGRRERHGLPREVREIDRCETSLSRAGTKGDGKTASARRVRTCSVRTCSVRTRRIRTCSVRTCCQGMLSGRVQSERVVTGRVQSGRVVRAC